MTYEHILFIGFGGPAKREEIEPFLRQVASGRNIPEERLREVFSHYELVGGYSPYNACCFRLVENVKQVLESDLEAPLAVFVGMRNWHPFLAETLAEIKSRNLKKGIAIVLSAYRSESSFERYQKDVENAKRKALAMDISYDYVSSWFDHPAFIEAQSDEIRKTVERMTPRQRETFYPVFCTHSIPLNMAGCDRYISEFKRSSELVAKHSNLSRWGLAYQSRSGNPGEPWLGPDIIEHLAQLKNQGESTVMVIPIGFFCDNVEVLYDLDIEAREAAQKLGLNFFRAPTVNDHPKFAKMFSELIQTALIFTP